MKVSAGGRALLAQILTVGAYAHRFEWKTGEDESYLARAGDAWPIGLFRYTPRGAAADLPVLLAHDFGTSRLIYDLDDRVSLARHLAGEGFDTWLVDLRGRHKSWPAGRPDARMQWTFDDFVTLDLPAAIDRTCEITGATQVLFVGHGLSGQAFYALALQGLADRVHAAVTLAAPAATPKSAMIPGITHAPLHRSGGRVPLARSVHRAAPVLAAAESQSAALRFAPGSTHVKIIARHLRSAVIDESEALADQLGRGIEAGGLGSRDGAGRYVDRLAEIALPLLLVAGSADVQQPIDAVRSTFDALGSADKAMFEAGRHSGLDGDYGNLDLLLGRTAPRDIYPQITAWLKDRC